MKRLTFAVVAGGCPPPPPPPVGLCSRFYAAVGFHTCTLTHVDTGSACASPVFPCYSVNFNNKGQTGSLGGVPAKCGRLLSERLFHLSFSEPSLCIYLTHSDFICFCNLPCSHLLSPPSRILLWSACIPGSPRKRMRRGAAGRAPYTCL